MRLFTAIEIPTEIRLRLEALTARLRPAAKLAWSPPDHLHVTTKFVGEWPRPRLQEVKDALAGVRPAGAFEISIRGLGWFPDARQAKVFFAGIEAGPELAALAKSTETALASVGVPVEEREYRPHLTLARRRDAVPIEALREMVDGIPAPDFGTFQASSFTLYLSAPGKYYKLEEYHW